MTWKQAETALRACKVILIPLGARLKEHGPHLPLNNDWVMAEYLTRRVVQECDVLAIPTLEHGFYPAFVEYPGSIHIGLETARDYLMDICRSLARFGPKKFYVLNTGVSTIRMLAAARELLVKDGIKLEYSDMRLVGARARNSVRESKGGTHADELETSVMLYIAPKIVNMKAAKKDFHDHAPDGVLTRIAKNKNATYSPTGTWGDPTLATRAKGKLITEDMVKDLVGSVKGFMKGTKRLKTTL